MILAWSLLPASGQDTKDKPAREVMEIVIKTSAQCGMCKERIERDMSFEKGIKYVNLDLETKDLTVRYRTDKSTPEEIRRAVARIGYDADDVPADPEAYERLPACCRKGGHD